MENEIVKTKTTKETAIFETDGLKLEVTISPEQDTVWLSRIQMAELFDRDIKTIGKHIANARHEELKGQVVVAKFATTTQHGAIQGKTQTHSTEYYNLDVIISVGYRVKSNRGVEFRKWANKILKEFILKGYVFNQRIDNLERRVSKTEEKIDFFVRTSLPPVEGVFFQGQIFDAYAKFESFIQSAEQEIVLIDNYIDISVLERFSKKQKDVKVTIYTDPKTKLSEQDIQKFNEQYSQLIIEHTSKTHDRFLIIDNKILYHIGASLKDLGKKCFAFEIMDSAWIKEILKNL